MKKNCDEKSKCVTKLIPWIVKKQKQKSACDKSEKVKVGQKSNCDKTKIVIALVT